MIFNCMRRFWLTTEKNFLLERNVKPQNEILWDQVIMSRTQGDEVQLDNDLVGISLLSLSARCAQRVWFELQVPLERRAKERMEPCGIEAIRGMVWGSLRIFQAQLDYLEPVKG